MRRCSALMSQPDSMKSQASQSSSSGCDGGSHCEPRSSLVLTMPVPKYACQTRLTKARAAVGDFLSTSHLPNVRRVGGASLGSGFRNDGTPAVTFSCGLNMSPRLSTNVSRISSRGFNTNCVAGLGCCFHSASILSLAAFHSGTVVRSEEHTSELQSRGLI